MILTAHDSLKVFRMTEERLTSALERHPHVRDYAEFSIVKTSTSFENEPGWNDEDYVVFRDGIKNADILVGYMFPLEEIRTIAPQLKWIHIIGAGIEHLHPLAWLPENVMLTNNRGAHAPKTREYAMMAMLMLGNHMPRLATAQRNSHWDGHFVSIIEGSTVLVVGAGKQGSAVANAAKTLGVRAIGVDPDTALRGDFDEIAPPSELHSLLPKADFVVLTLPYTQETHKFFGAKEFGLMKESAGFVNICRGKVVDHTALIEALKNGKISGAILDALEEEPLPENSPLWSTPNLTITPHMGCDDEENYIHRTFDIVMENIDKLIRGERLDNLIDPKKGY